MNFKNDHLLNNEALQNLITSRFPNEKSSLITTQLKYYILINNGKIYNFDFNHVYYTEFNFNTDESLTIVSLYIEMSFKNLNKADQENLNYRSKNKYFQQPRNPGISATN